MKDWFKEEKEVGHEWNNNDYYVRQIKDSYDHGYAEMGEDYLNENCDEDEKLDENLPYSDYRVSQLQKFDHYEEILELMVCAKFIENFDKNKLWDLVWNPCVDQIPDRTKFSEVVNSLPPF